MAATAAAVGGEGGARGQERGARRERFQSPPLQSVRRTDNASIRGLVARSIDFRLTQKIFLVFPARVRVRSFSLSLSSPVALAYATATAAGERKKGASRAHIRIEKERKRRERERERQIDGGNVKCVRAFLESASAQRSGHCWLAARRAARSREKCTYNPARLSSARPDRI